MENDKSIIDPMRDSRLKALYKPPFKHDHGYIFDANGNMVSDQSGGEHIARVRGWGRLGAYEDGAALQDAIGDRIAKILTKEWDKDH